jgi:hypothetical protein
LEGDGFARVLQAAPHAAQGRWRLIVNISRVHAKTIVARAIP